MKTFLRKLYIGFSYQWRWSIFIRRVSNYLQGAGETFTALFTGILGIIALLFFPIYLLWENTGLIIWLALTAPLDTMEKLYSKIK